MAILPLLLAAAAGYLLGNFQTGMIIGRLFGKVDLRTKGSGGTGATNAMRTLGLRAGVLTFLGDLLKGTAASLIGRTLAGESGQLLAALFVVIGHIWPVFFRFHGGKGVSTTVGALAIIYPWLGVLCVGTSIVLIAITRYVSLGNCAGIFLFALIMIGSTIRTQNPWLLLCVLISALVIFAHRKNLVRLLRGTENKLSVGKKN